MSEPKTIAVLGATGARGGGLVRAIANDPAGEFRARAITRNPRSDAAKALAALPNVEVVTADLDDPASIEGVPGRVRRLLPMDFDAWLAQNASKIPVR